MPLCGLRLLFALGTLSLVEVRWGWASIPKLCFLFNVAGGRIRVCGLLSRCWMVDSDFFFCVRLPIVDGTGVFVVWWSVKFVFRIVDGTGMFSVFS